MNQVFYFVDDISTPFIIKDIQLVSERSENVILFSCEILPEKQSLPNNVKVIEEFINWKKFNGVNIFIQHFFSILAIYFKESLAIRKLLPFKRSIALLSSNIFKANEIERQLKDLNIAKNSNAIYYSFWFYDCIYLAWIKKKYHSVISITRAHSGDLYENHISIRDKILFRHFQMKYLDAVFPISNMGSEYLRNKYSKYQKKIKTLFLGTVDQGALNPFNQQNFVLVSVASFRHHKRIHRIAETLLNIDFPLTWYHFGNENLHTNDPKISEYLRLKKALEGKTNIKYFPMGETDNDKIFEFYKHTPVSLFISLSAAEGIPVSIMEAISFGIPVLSTDVGGCGEIVNEHTGILIPLETDVKEIAGILENFIISNKNTAVFRNAVRQYWSQNFNIKDNYNHFFDAIQTLEHG